MTTQPLSDNHNADGMAQVEAELGSRLLTRSEICKGIGDGSRQLFPGVHVSIFLLDPASGETVDSIHLGSVWEMSPQDREWLSRRTKELLIRSDKQAGFLYVPDRAKFLHADKQQLRDDSDRFAVHCGEILYQLLISDDDLILGIVALRAWQKEGPRLGDIPDFDDRLDRYQQFARNASIALDNLQIHQKIEGLIVDKRELKLRIQRDEEDLKRRILELTVLYDTSNSLGYSLDYYQIVRLVIDGLARVLNFDVCAVFLLDFVPGGEIVTRINKPLDPSFVSGVQANIVAAIIPFIRRQIDPESVKLTSELSYRPSATDQVGSEVMKSFANVPLIFKEEVIGMLNVCSTSRNAFPRNEMTFLHTMANQLASHLGRLKIVKKLEKSKMDSVIRSMTEAVIMVDENDRVEFINPAASELFLIKESDRLAGESLIRRFQEIGVESLYRRTLKTGKSYLNQEIIHRDSNYLVNITPVFSGEKNRIGTVLVLRDFTEIQKSNRIKTQRLDIISQVDVIIRSITDLDNLLSVLMQFILSVVNADMGAIQLQSGKKLSTKVHGNFPDKIRRDYQFKSGETISEFVGRNKDLCFIEDYHSDPRVNPDVKILIESYVAIPIMVKNDLIGVVSIVRKFGTSHPKITHDDIRTLMTITSLSGTAIQNALLFQETLKKQRLDQELRIATEIHTKLLPGQVPNLSQIGFGAVSVPAREIGGDYYDFFAFDDGSVGICIADIVGKGIPAGLYMAMLKSLLHSRFQGLSSPAEALTKVNELLYRDPVINKFVPLLYAILDPNQMTLRYCNAGHEPAIIYSENGVTPLSPQGLPLGALLDSEYVDEEVQLKEGDVVVFFTDGIIDAKNALGNRFGVDGVQRIIANHRHLSAKGISDQLYNGVLQFMGTVAQPDDITLVTVKVDSDYSPSDDDLPNRTKTIRVTSAKKHIKKIRQEVASIAKELGFPDDDIFNIKLAINEAHANVIEHAYAGSDAGEILFQFLLFDDRLEIVIKDFGAGMGQRSIKGEDHLDELEGSGLGVFLIKTVMDRVRYRRTSRVGTELWLTKLLPAKFSTQIVK